MGETVSLVIEEHPATRCIHAALKCPSEANDLANRIEKALGPNSLVIVETLLIEEDAHRFTTGFLMAGSRYRNRGEK